MPTIGFAKVKGGPEEALSFVLESLKEKGFNVEFYRHHWAGDMPFGLVIAETDKGKVAVRWYIGDSFSFKLEEVSEDAFEEFIDETLDYLGGD
ncbi:hypothetical protein [Pyrococcus abyssi]|uniref:Uncharacterized protein n=1 Tax=Pyrococcus abyssi (strain GE5 / Orsay) TaxID=272844 RepID=G8ZGY9_PYRAB|nr:hypothetical protein [Pyrococcus abyssi]CCE70184.1 TPA: hypothetical protein PAB0531.1n [Pyrococcus abyssi GE5]